MTSTTERGALLAAGIRLAFGLAVVLWAGAAGAHVVYGTKTLNGSVAEADLVLRARIVASDDGLALPWDPATPRRPSVEAEVLEVMKGSLDEPRVRFVQHGHGVARFEAGEEAVLFLVDIARSRELDALGRSGAFAWVSLQEHDDEYPLGPGTREPLLEAVRAYVAAGTAPEAAVRMDRLRRATLALLASGDPHLAASAVRDLVLAPTLPLVTREDLPSLERVLGDPSTSMGVRVGLLSELERRGLVEGPPRWLQLLAAAAPPPDRITVIRAAGLSASPVVRTRLIAVLADPDPRVAAAAAAALGVPGNVPAVEPLVASLSHPSEQVRMAAIRGLGEIAAPESLRALESAAASHPDPATQRRARAEVRKRHPAASPPTPPSAARP